MGADELPGWLAVIGIPTTIVAVGAEVDRTWCLRAVPDRLESYSEEGGAAWEVFWCERGGRFAWTRFDDESAACFHLFGRLAWAQVARGALVARE